MADIRFQGSSELGPRGDAIKQMDYITGQLVDHLQKRGLKDNTLIVFSSDNGPVAMDGYFDQSYEMLGEHKPAGKLRGGKYSAFEAGTRVPFIISWPNRIKPGKSEALVNQLDLYASIASLLKYKLQQGEASDSLDLLDTFLGKNPKGRDLMLRESCGNFSLRKGNLKYIRPTKRQMPWIQDHKKIEGGISSEAQLYDLSIDIGEKVNLAKKKPELITELESVLQSLIEKPER